MSIYIHSKSLHLRHLLNVYLTPDRLYRVDVLQIKKHKRKHANQMTYRDLSVLSENQYFNILTVNSEMLMPRYKRTSHELQHFKGLSTHLYLHSAF